MTSNNCDPVEQQLRQERLDALYEADGRHDPKHPMHALYTGLLIDKEEEANAALAQPEPVPVSELVDLAHELRRTAEYLQGGCGWIKALDAIERAATLIENGALTSLGRPAIEPEERWYPNFADWLEREMPEGTVIGDPLWWASKIATYLQRYGRPAIEPVPVSEQPWKREGWCDEEGRCWWGRGFDEMNNCDWFYSTYAEVCEYCEHAMPTSVLPHWAMPVPQQEVE